MTFSFRKFCLCGFLGCAALVYSQSSNVQSMATGAATLQLPLMPLHDPWILACEKDQTYYLYTSNIPALSGTSGAGTMAYRSKDLKDWQKPVAVFLVPKEFWAASGGWAPEVHFYHGRYYLFTTVHDESNVFAKPPEVWKPNYRRGTIVAVSDKPEGPFTIWKKDGPLPPSDFMTLDGTLFVEPNGKPWLVYAHEWIQKIDGTIEAVPLKEDLSGVAGDPIYLFKGSDAPWLNAEGKASRKESLYVTDGPELYRTKDGHLLMLWSSYNKEGYVQAVARSTTGTLQGPWEQLAPLVKQDSGHGMLFHSFDGKLLLVLHRPFRNARGKIYEVQDAGDHLEVVAERTDLDGETKAE